MSRHIHSLVEDADDLHTGPGIAEENYVAALGVTEKPWREVRTLFP